MASSDVELFGNFENGFSVYAGLLSLEDRGGVKTRLLHGPLVTSIAISFLLVRTHSLLVGQERSRMDGSAKDSQRTNDEGVTTYSR